MSAIAAMTTTTRLMVPPFSRRPPACRVGWRRERQCRLAAQAREEAFALSLVGRRSPHPRESDDPAQLADLPGLGRLEAPFRAPPVVESVATGGQSILVVDDDAESRATVSRLIAGAGFSPIEATGGEEALAAAREAPPAL